MKKTLLIAAALVMGLGSANADTYDVTYNAKTIDTEQSWGATSTNAVDIGGKSISDKYCTIAFGTGMKSAVPAATGAITSFQQFAENSMTITAQDGYKIVGVEFTVYNFNAPTIAILADNETIYEEATTKNQYNVGQEGAALTKSLPESGTISATSITFQDNKVTDAEGNTTQGQLFYTEIIIKLQAVNVTYSLTIDGSTNTATATVPVGGKAEDYVPESIFPTSGVYTYTYDPETITSETETVTITATKVATSEVTYNYVTSDGTEVYSEKVSDIVAGNEASTYATENWKSVAYTGTDAYSESDTYGDWYEASTYTMTDAEGTAIEGTTITDATSTVKVTLKERNYAEAFTTDYDKYLTTTGGYYMLSSEEAEAFKTYETTCNYKEYASAKDEILSKAAAHTPETGYYRIYTTNQNSASASEYRYFGGDGEKAYNYVGAQKSLSTVVKLEKQTDGTYYISVNGLYVQSATTGATEVALGESPVAYTFQIVDAIGYIRIGTNPEAAANTANWLNGNANNNSTIKLVNAVYGTNGWSIWNIKDAAGDKFSVTMNSIDETNYYATLYIPFPATTDATASTIKVSKNDDDTYTAEPTAVSTISVGQGVLLSGSSATATLTVASSDEASNQDNDLEGTYFDVTSEEDTYVFSAVDNKIGFYNWPSNNTLDAYKAYMPKSVANGARGIILNVGETTGINAAQKAVENGKVYDLQGREIKTMQRGIYIMNGKKIVK